MTDADNDVTVTAYSSAGQVISVTDPNSNVTTYSFDAMNRETGMTAAAGSAIAGVSTFTFDKAGNQVTATDPDNDTTTTTYDYAESYYLPPSHLCRPQKNGSEAVSWGRISVPKLRVSPGKVSLVLTFRSENLVSRAA